MQNRQKSLMAAVIVVGTVLSVCVGVSTAHSDRIASGWMFRLQSLGNEFEGLLQVLPPHESEWGTVCGNSERMNQQLRHGATEARALEAFFSSDAALVACRSAGLNVSSARAFRLSKADGWGSGNTYMSNVECRSELRGTTAAAGSLPGTLDACYFTTSAVSSDFLQHQCDRADDVYVRCGAGGLESPPTVDDVSLKDIVRSHRQYFSVQADGLGAAAPTSAVLVAKLSSCLKVALAISGLMPDSSGLSCTFLGNSTSQAGSNLVFSYFNISFAAGGGAGSMTGDETAAPDSTPVNYMTILLGTSTTRLLEAGIWELRADSEDDYGVIDSSATPRFQMNPLEANLYLPSNVSSTVTTAGYLQVQMGAQNFVAGNVCNVTASTRLLTATYVCDALQQTTFPSLLIPHFGSLATGVMMVSNLQIIGVNPVTYRTVTSQYFEKRNDCAEANAVGIICGPGQFANLGLPGLQFCARVFVDGDPLTVFRSAVSRELLLAPSRITQSPQEVAASSGSTLCFHLGYSYSFKDNTSTAGFDIFDLQYIFSSMNAFGWLMLSAVPMSVAAINVPSYVPVTPTVVTFKTYPNITPEIMVDAIRGNLSRVFHVLVDPEDVVLISDKPINYDLPKKPVPTPAPTTEAPATPAPTPVIHHNRHNKTRTYSVELTLTENVSVTRSISQVKIPVPTNEPNTTTSGPTPSPEPTTNSPVVLNAREIVLQFMFEDPANKAFSLVNTLQLFPWLVFASPPVVIVPPPPPPDKRPLIAGTTMAGIAALCMIITAIIVVKRVFYTRTSKRWDDDYVMMNLQVLTVPLSQIEMETPRRKTHTEEVTTGDRDTAELF